MQPRNLVLPRICGLIVAYDCCWKMNESQKVCGTPVDGCAKERLTSFDL
jgi:hypothetical protein